MDWCDRLGPPSDDLGALMWLLAKAGPDGVTRASYRGLASSWGWSLGKVQRFVARAVEAGAVDTKTIQGQTTFQVNMAAHRAAPTRKTDTRSDTPKIDLLGPVPKKRATRLPDDWLLPKAWGEFAVAQGMTEFEVRREADIFRDFWHAKSGKDATKVDWQATWRNWIRRNVDNKAKRLASRSTDSEADAYLRKYQ